ncbi:MAG: response regulator transcription factor [Opitutae bacterium]|nr:response regulator transcription factor [Opitutae bacterium]
MNALPQFASTPASVTPGVLFRALIVDPGHEARLGLGDQLAFHADFELAASCASLAEAAEQIPVLAPELVIVEWSALEDFTLWRALAGLTRAVIVTSAEPRHAVQAFEVGALDYLLKPVAPARFGSAIARARVVLRTARLSAMPPAAPAVARLRAERLVLKRDGEFHLVAPRDVLRLEAEGDYVKVFTRTGTHLVRTTLARIGAQLDPSLFLRVHRSHIVNRDHVTKATLRPEGDFSLTLGASGTVPVARAQTGAVRRLLD